MPRLPWTGRVCIQTGFALFHGLSGDNCAHSHHALQVVLAEESFGIEIGGDLISSSGIVIQSDQNHRLLPASVHIIYIEPESHAGRMVRHQLNNQRFIQFSPELCKRGLEALLNFDASLPAFTMILELLCASIMEGTQTLDDRIDEALTLIQENLEYPLSYVELAERVSLSESHFRSLFLTNTGLSMKRYRLWARLKRTLALALDGLDFTAAAHRAGFSDSAHFSRTFKSMFGTTPSLALKALDSNS